MGKIKSVKITCGWCKNEFSFTPSLNKDGEHSILTCPNCARILPASKKVKLDSVVGKTHIHEDYKDGDIA
jgi:transcription elongation factor Elf1